MGPRRADDAVVALRRLSSTCGSIAIPRRRANGPRPRCLSASAPSTAPAAATTTTTTTTLSRPRPHRRRDHGLAWACGRRKYVVPSSSEGSRIAVLGGGLTGLTTAYYLAKELPPSAKVTLLEGSDRLGGWIRTDRVPVDIGGVKGTVSFERGPRTLSSLHKSTWRYDDLVLYDLALNLGLKIFTPPDGARYIYYPDHLVPLPPASSLAQFIREPLFLESVWGGLGFLLRRLRRRPVPSQDISIAEWLHEICGSRAVADNLASAMIHGIYGGDVDKLSARVVLDRFFWGYYLPNLGSNVRHMPAREEALMSSLGRDPQIRKLALRARGTLLHFGEAGMESLTEALADALQGQPNVEIKLREPVSKIDYNPETRKVEITTSRSDEPQQQQQQQDQVPESYDKVISTLTSQDLARVTGGKLPSLAQTHSVSVMTVNLWYPQTDMKPRGFGYLIPRSIPRERNPERALGVFFDSDVVGAAGPGEPPGTKLFVLMGGHYYDRDKDATPPPSEDEAVEQAKAVLERHLGIPRSTPCFAMARLASECIPQHHVGHQDRMVQAEHDLREAFAGRLAVAGGSYSKIGVMGALRGGYDVAKQTLSGGEQGWLATGLEHMEPTQSFAGVPVWKIPVRRFD